jgi:hypothetical protein
VTGDAVDTARRSTAADPYPNLDGTLRPLFERWHPGLAAHHPTVETERAAA